MLNHTEQRVGDPLTQELARGQDLPLGKVLPSLAQAFRAASFTSWAFGLQTGSGLRAVLGRKWGELRWKHPVQPGTSLGVDLQDHPPGAPRGPTAQG